MVDIEYWKALWLPRDLADSSSEAGDVAFYAEYPAELADELAEGIVSLLTSKQKPFFLVSPLLNGVTWWRLFHSLCPDCPVSSAPFLSLSACWFDERAELLPSGGVKPSPSAAETKRYRKILQDVAEEVRFFGMWVEATGRWNERPSVDDKVHQARRMMVKRLKAIQCEINRQGHVTPDGIISENDRDQRIGLKILQLLGLYKGYKRTRNELLAEAERVIADHAITAADVVGS